VPLHAEKEETMRNLTVVVCSLLFSGLAWAQPSPVAEKKLATPEALEAEIEALKATKVAWREIAWKSCLGSGYGVGSCSRRLPHRTHVGDVFC
jgi:hypothetical protein